MPRRSVEAIGAVRWINYNSQRAKDTGVFGFDIDTRFTADILTGLETFSAAAGVTASTIRAEGNFAISHGTHRRPGKMLRQVQGSGTSLDVYRRLTENWAQTDATREESDEDSAIRFTVFPKWSNNSCAVDCTLFVGIMLNAGRSIVDTLPTTPLTPAQRSHPSHTFRSILHVLWGTLQPRQHNALRDVLSRRLATYDSTKFKHGSYMSVDSVLEACFASFASVSCTLMTRGARICCDKMVRYDGRTKCSDFTVLRLTCAAQDSFESIVNQFFGSRAIVDQSVCSNGTSCTRQCYRRFVVVDDGYRLPPTFIVTFAGPVSARDATRMSLFAGSVSICAQFPDSEVRYTYLVVGCIYLRFGCHFTSRWRVSGDEYVEYDGMISVHSAGNKDSVVRLAPVGSFLSQLTESNCSIVAVILRIQESPQQWGGRSIRHI